MEQRDRQSKRSLGWAKPYWARAGLYVCVTLVSFLVSLLMVRFGCGGLLRAAISAEPVVWRAAELVLDLLLSAGVAWYFASREGYTKRTSGAKICVVGGLLFLLAQFPVALLCQGAPLATGPMAASLSELLYFGNGSIYASSIDSPPPMLTLACMVVTEAAVLIPVVTLAERYGAKAYRQEVAAIKEEHPG